MKILTPIVFAVAVISAPNAKADKPQIQWDPDYDFSQVSTFAWSDTASTSIQSNDPFLHQHIINAIEYQLTSHGLAEVSDGADVRVTYHMSIDTDIRLQSTSMDYGFGNYGRPGWGYRGYGIRGPIYTDTRVVEIERGNLMVDIWDTGSNELVWRGEAADITISGNREKTIRNVEKAIERMAKQNDKLRRRED